MRPGRGTGPAGGHGRLAVAIVIGAIVEHLFATTPAHRVQAGTEIDNIAEQKALEKAGFKREGVNRGLYFRAGQWRDSVMYGLLRGEEHGSTPTA